MIPVTFETIHGKRLRVARVGKGKSLVLLHGYPDNLQIWSNLIRELSADFEIVAFDWPGMGFSEAWPGGATPHHLAVNLVSILDFLEIERCVLAGMDMGGQPALVFAANHPERIDHLIVMNCLAFGEEKTSWEIRLLRKFAWNRWLLRSLPHLIFYRALLTFLPSHARLSAEIRNDLWSAFRQPQVRQYISKMCAGYQGTLSRLPESYRQIRCPTLILWAEQDAHFPVIHGEKLRETIAGSELKILSDAHHWMVWHDAAAVGREIRRSTLEKYF